MLILSQAVQLAGADAVGPDQPVLGKPHLVQPLPEFFVAYHKKIPLFSITGCLSAARVRRAMRQKAAAPPERYEFRSESGNTGRELNADSECPLSKSIAWAKWELGQSVAKIVEICEIHVFSGKSTDFQRLEIM